MGMPKTNGAKAEVPQRQMAVVFEKNGGELQYKEIDVPQPGPDEVLVNIKYTGVCHTDLHAWHGDWPLATKSPLVGGHEGAGIVVAVGSQVSPSHISIGDRAGIKWLNGSCLSCSFCMRGDEQLCPHALLSGYTVDGSFQQYAIGKAAHVARIPESVPLDGVAPILCAGVTVYRALKETGCKPGETVAVLGAGGGLGSLACQYAKAMGIRVVAVDSGEVKRKMCLEKLGCDYFADFATSKDLVKEMKEKSNGGEGPNAVLVLAVAEKPFQQAAEYVRPHGTIVAVGLPANAKLSADVFSTVTKMIQIKGSYVGNRADTEECLEFYRRGLINAPFKVMNLSELGQVYKMMEKGEIAGRIVLDTSA